MTLLKCKSNDPVDINNYRPIEIATALSNVWRDQVRLAVATHKVYMQTADCQCFQTSTFDRNAETIIFAV